MDDPAFPKEHRGLVVKQGNTALPAKSSSRHCPFMEPTPTLWFGWFRADITTEYAELFWRGRGMTIAVTAIYIVPATALGRVEGGQHHRTVGVWQEHAAARHQRPRSGDDRTGMIGALDRTFMFIGALMGFVGVGLGAFGAHGLKGRLSAEMLAVFETGVRYQMYHALALLALGAMMSRLEGRAVVVAGWSFTAGILIFSGSLYALALSGVTMLGAITPIGGAAFLIGWIALAIAAF